MNTGRREGINQASDVPGSKTESKLKVEETVPNIHTKSV
jgi:hypothetical protein